MNKQLFIGMDLHRNSSSFCVKDKDGKIYDEAKIRTEPVEVQKYINNFKDSEISLVLEPVSQWHFYADLIQKLNVDVRIANPLKVKAIASARIKTDKIDSSVLCDLLRTNLLPEAYFAPLEVRNWKELARFRASLINLRTQAKNKIHSLLHKNGLTFQFSRLFGKAGRVWLKSLRLSKQYQMSLDKYLELIEHLDRLVKESEKTVEETVTDHPQAKLLTSIPGISYVSALTIMAEIGDVNRFPSAKQLQCYAGLVPSTYASGGNIRHGRLTKQGSRWLRWIMIEAAHKQVLCKNRVGLSWYYMKTRNRKGSKTAAVATARKLLAVVWKLLKDNRPFEERFQSWKSEAPANKFSS